MRFNCAAATVLLLALAAPASAQYFSKNNGTATLEWTYTDLEQLALVKKFAVQYALVYGVEEAWKTIGTTDPTSDTPMTVNVRLSFPKGYSLLYFRVAAVDAEGLEGEPSNVISFERVKH